VANKSIKLNLRNERVEALERRVGLVEKLLNDNTCAMRDGLKDLAGEIKGLKENELEHIYGEMQEIKKYQEGIGEFQAEIKGSIKMLKYIIAGVLALIPIVLKILNMVWK